MSSPFILLISTNNADISATIRVDNRVYGYFFASRTYLDNLLYIYRKSPLKALNYAKRYSLKVS